MQRRHLLALGALVAAVGFLLLPTASQARGAPVLAWTPTTGSGTYDFGAVDAVAGSSVTKTFTLTNSGTPDPTGTIYVSDCEANAIDVFAPGSTGNIAPERTITGPDTGLSNPCDVKVDSAGDVYAADLGNGSITEYAPQASGDATPVCTISGSNTGLTSNGIDDFSLEANGTLVVGTYQNSSVLVFAPNSCGNVAPVETIAGPNTGFNLVDGVGTDADGTIYADDSQGITINVFPAGANGNVAPEYTIAGPNTLLTGPDDIVVSFSGKLYVTNGFGFGTGGDSIAVFAPGARGNATPIQDIAGSNTTFAGGVDDLAVDDLGKIYVTDALANEVAIFAAGATGNVAPTAVISGSNTTLVEPEGVAVAGPEGPPTGASVTTLVSTPTLALGQSTSDTATVTRGTNNTSPTGALVFTLYGPGDNTCSGTPAYVSPTQVVSGAGAYASPSFTPKATGVYSWVVQYSGDTHNAAVTTACADSAEAVTVLLQYTLSVAKTGSGAGTVTSSPSGINCGSTCSNGYTSGTLVTLSAAAASGSTFAGWSGACLGSSTCKVAMSAAMSVTATFNKVPKACVVPKVKGKSLKAAKRAIKAHHCRVGKIKRTFSKKVKKGHVISQKPKPGKRLKHGAKVKLAVSKGRR
jgi:hypothetical protein